MTNNKNEVFVSFYVCTSVDVKRVRRDMISWIVRHFVFASRPVVIEGLVTRQNIYCHCYETLQDFTLSCDALDAFCKQKFHFSKLSVYDQ